jgi:hypothetical protein
MQFWFGRREVAEARTKRETFLQRVSEKCVVASCSSSSFVLGFAGNFEDEDETRTEFSDTFAVPAKPGRIPMWLEERARSPDFS